MRRQRQYCRLRPRERPTQRRAFCALPRVPPAFDILGWFALYFGGPDVFDFDGRMAFNDIARHDRRRLDLGALILPAPNGLRPHAPPAIESFSPASRRELPLPGPASALASSSAAVQTVCAARQIVGGRCERGSGRQSLSAWLGSRAPNRPAAATADLPPVRGQACQLHVIGRGARRADDQHRQIIGASPSGPTLAPIR